MFSSTALTLFLSLTATLSKEEHGVYFQIKENAVLFDENVISIEKVASLLQCSQLCAKREICESASLMADEEKCLMHKGTRTGHHEMLLKRQGSFYLEKVAFIKLIRKKKESSLFSPLNTGRPGRTGGGGGGGGGRGAGTRAKLE